MTYQLPLDIQITINTPVDSSNDWYTPPDWIAKARACLGEIDLDPCSCELAQSVVKAKLYYTSAQDGLCQRWIGRTWLNPPYDKPAPWTDRLIDSYSSGLVLTALCLVNSSIAARWFQRLAQNATRRLDISPRINFWSPVNSGNGNRYDQTLFYFGVEPVRFEQTFIYDGTIYNQAVTR